MPYKRKDAPHWWIAWSEQGRRVSVSSGTADYPEAKALEHERRAGYRAEHCPDSPWVFTRDGKRIWEIRNAFRTACQRVGITDFHPRDLRHTCATWLVQAGGHLRTVAEIMRHKSIQTTMRYAHHAPEDASAGVAILEQCLPLAPHGARQISAGKGAGPDPGPPYLATAV